MKIKKLLKQYAPLFLVVYVGAFFALVTFHGKYDFPTLPGDILIERQRLTIYVPFTSAGAFSMFAIGMKEVYTFFKRF